MYSILEQRLYLKLNYRLRDYLSVENICLKHKCLNGTIKKKKINVMLFFLQINFCQFICAFSRGVYRYTTLKMDHATIAKGQLKTRINRQK